jgi:hypothetical protein
MTKLVWNTTKNKKEIAPYFEPHKNWQTRTPPNNANIETYIRNGYNAFLWRLPNDIWVVDADHATAVAWVRERLGAPAVITPRGAHWLVRGDRPILPPDAPDGIDTEPRQLFGPGTAYPGPEGETRRYTGGVPDLSRVVALNGHFNGTPPLTSSGHQRTPTDTLPPAPPPPPPIPVSAPSSPAGDFFAPAPINRDRAATRMAALCETIRTSTSQGAAARGEIRDAAFFAGGLLHAGWFTRDQAATGIADACAARWGSADDADDKWITQGLTDGARKPLPVRQDGNTTEPGKDEHERVSSFTDDIAVDDELDDVVPAEPLVTGLIDRGKFAMLYGPGGSGKSFVALDMALCVATGLPWHGRDTSAGKVLFVAAEGVSGLAARRRAWRSRHPGIVFDKAFHTLKRAVDLFGQTAPHDVADTLAYCLSHEIKLVVFDTYNRCAPGLEENSAKDTSVVNAHLGQFTQAGIAVLLIHHTPKDGSTPRGSGSLVWATDHALMVSKARDSVTVLNARQKDREDGDSVYLSLVAEQTSGSAYLVDSIAPSTEVGAPDEPAYDVFDLTPLGADIDGYAGHGSRHVRTMALYMSRHAGDDTIGRSRQEAMKDIGLKHDNRSARSAWDALMSFGALSAADGTRVGTGRHRWVPPGERRTAEKIKRALS